LARVECRRLGAMMPRLQIGYRVACLAMTRQRVGHSRVAHLHQRPLTWRRSRSPSDLNPGKPWKPCAGSFWALGRVDCL